MGFGGWTGVVITPVQISDFASTNRLFLKGSLPFALVQRVLYSRRENGSRKIFEILVTDREFLIKKKNLP